MAEIEIRNEFRSDTGNAFEPLRRAVEHSGEFPALGGGGCLAIGGPHTVVKGFELDRVGAHHMKSVLVGVAVRVLNDDLVFHASTITPLPPLRWALAGRESADCQTQRRGGSGGDECR